MQSRSREWKWIVARLLVSLDEDDSMRCLFGGERTLFDAGLFEWERGTFEFSRERDRENSEFNSSLMCILTNSR